MALNTICVRVRACSLFSVLDRSLTSPHFLHEKNSDLYGTNVTKRSYDELGSIDHGNCCCCVYVEFSSSSPKKFGPISPGCGCNGKRVDEIALLLKQRIMRHQQRYQSASGNVSDVDNNNSKRSTNTFQMQQDAHKALHKLNEFDTKLVSTTRNLNFADVLICADFFYRMSDALQSTNFSFSNFTSKN